MHITTVSNSLTRDIAKRWIVFGVGGCIVFLSAYAWLLGSYSLLPTTYPLPTSWLADISVALGRLFGIFAQLLLLFQVLLVARIPWIEQSFGFDRMNAVHRWNGFFVLLFLFSHPLLLAYGHGATYDLGIWAMLVEFATNWENVIGGVFAICIYAIIGFTSWHIVRYRAKYEWWYGVHFLTYLALFMGFGHQSTFTTFASSNAAAFFWFVCMFGTVGLFLAYRWVYPLYLSYKHRFVVERVVQETPDTTSIYITGRRMSEFIFDAGQYTSWRFHFGPLFWPWAQSQLKTGFFFPHPFSFSQTYNGHTIRLTAKALGDFTKQLPLLYPGVRVTLTRPLGRFILPRRDMALLAQEGTAAHARKLLLIAGGIGITPVRCIAEAAHGMGIESTLLYGAKTRADFALLNECKKFAAKVACFVSNEIVAEQGFYNGQIDTPALLRECPDVRERDVYVCGPTGMMMSIVTQLETLGVPKSQIHYERFGY